MQEYKKEQKTHGTNRKPNHVNNSINKYEWSEHIQLKSKNCQMHFLKKSAPNICFLQKWQLKYKTQRG